jgi:hypothetical protein
MLLRVIRERLGKVAALVKVGDLASANWEAKELFWGTEEMTDLPPAVKDAVHTWFSLFDQLEDLREGVDDPWIRPHLLDELQRASVAANPITGIIERTDDDLGALRRRYEGAEARFLGAVRADQPRVALADAATAVASAAASWNAEAYRLLHASPGDRELELLNERTDSLIDLWSELAAAFRGRTRFP